jgi:hypothetical protein
MARSTLETKFLIWLFLGGIGWYVFVIRPSTQHMRTHLINVSYPPPRSPLLNDFFYWDHAFFNAMTHMYSEDLMRDYALFLAFGRTVFAGIYGLLGFLALNWFLIQIPYQRLQKISLVHWSLFFPVLAGTCEILSNIGLILLLHLKPQTNEILLHSTSLLNALHHLLFYTSWGFGVIFFVFWIYFRKIKNLPPKDE